VGASVDELWAVMRGEADEETRSRVVESLEANDPALMKFLEARKERAVRVLHGSIDFGAFPTEPLAVPARKPPGEKDEPNVPPER